MLSKSPLLTCGLVELESRSGKAGISPSPEPTVPTVSERRGTGIGNKQQNIDVLKSPACLPGKERDSSCGTGEGFGVPIPVPSPRAALLAEDLVRLGIHEGLPNQMMQQELWVFYEISYLVVTDSVRFQIYFDKIHHQVPFLHKYRLLAAFDLGLNLRPPAAFLYSMWAIAASVSPKYDHLAEVFYQRARWYAEAAEMKVCQAPTVHLHGLTETRAGEKISSRFIWHSAGS